MFTKIYKFTNFQPAPDGTPFTQDGQWSVPLPPRECLSLPEPAVYAIRQFVSIFLPEFDQVPFYSTKLCWYTDSLDNSFVVRIPISFVIEKANPDESLSHRSPQIDYVPDYAENSVFVCTGGSGHGAKFLPILGEVK